MIRKILIFTVCVCLAIAAMDIYIISEAMDKMNQTEQDTVVMYFDGFVFFTAILLLIYIITQVIIDGLRLYFKSKSN